MEREDSYIMDLHLKSPLLQQTGIIISASTCRRTGADLDNYPPLSQYIRVLCLSSFALLTLFHCIHLISHIHSNHIYYNMKLTYFLASLATLISSCAAVGVTGSAPGFAKGTTGGGSATPQYPANIAQLKSWLADSTARVIVLDKE